MTKKEEKFWIERANSFNQLRPKGMTLNQIRFFAIYQAKINAREPEKREVIFPLNDFVKIMALQRLNITKLKNTIDDLLRQIVHLPNDKNGFIAIPLFNECEVYQESGKWFVKIECHQKAMPYMFEMKKNYFKYRLWNALRLTSVNQIRMYEVLKQYEQIGTRTVEIDELKELLGISLKQYQRYDNFNKRVLKPCQKALAENTDIRYEYTPIRKSRKISAIKFDIFKNKDYKDVLNIDEFIDKTDIADAVEPEKKDLRDLYNKYFSKEQEEMFKAKIHTVLQGIYKSDDMLETRTNAIYSKCLINFEMKHQTGTLKNPVAYMSGIITNAVSAEIDKPIKEKNRSYNLNDFEKLAINHKEIEEIEQLNCEPENVKSEERICTQSEAVIRHSETERAITPIKEETALDDVENSSTDDVMQADADLCLKATEIIKSSADYENAIKLLDMVIVGWRELDGFFLEQINEALTEKKRIPEFIQ